MRKKILFIHHATTWGGAPNSMALLINRLDKTKFDAEVLLFRYSIVAERFKEKGIKYCIADSVFYRKYYQYFTHSEADYIKWYQLFRLLKFSSFWVFSRFFFAKKELAKHDFDLVHLNSSVLTDWLAPAKKLGKVIIHIREPFRNGNCDILNHFFKSQMRKYADRIIAISEDNAKRINIPEKTTVVYNYSIIEVLPDLKNENYSSKSALYVGGSESIKGFYTIVDALKYLNNGIIIYFSGYFSKILSDDSHDFQTRIKRFLKGLLYKKETFYFYKLKNSSNAQIVGVVSDINKYLDKCVCLVSPFSVPHFSRPIIEAFGRRKPAIATNIDGIDEIIDDGLNGILVENGNSKDLANAINLLCDNPAVAKRMGDKGYISAQEKFSQKNIIKIQQIYLTLMNGL